MLAGFIDAQSLLNAEDLERPPCSFFGDERLDRSISAALNARGIVEVYGPSGAGKSTLAMQAAASFLLTRPFSSVLYVYSGKPFSMRRFEQMLNTSHSDIQPILSRLILQHAGDIDSQLQCLSLDHLEALASGTPFPVGFLIVDSMSANFRIHKKTREVSFALQSMVFAMYDFAKRHHVHVLCINEVTSVIGSDLGISNLKSANAVPMVSISQGYKPTLGMSWSNSVSTRVEMRRKMRTDASDTVGPEREIVVHRSSECPPLQVKCRLQDCGLLSVDVTLCDNANN